MAKSDQPTTIKKYANRRLYNTGTSTYVTLEDLASMVKDGEDFLVYDAKTGDDITRSVLAQIIFEQEKKAGQNLLPPPSLPNHLPAREQSRPKPGPDHFPAPAHPLLWRQHADGGAEISGAGHRVAHAGAGEVPQADRHLAVRDPVCAAGGTGPPQYGAVPADLLDVQAFRARRRPPRRLRGAGARADRRSPEGQQYRRSAPADEGHAGTPRADVEEGRVGPLVRARVASAAAR